MNTPEQVQSNPYAPPRADVGPGGAATRRHPWIAVGLAIVSPVFTMLYVARAWRALGYVAALLGASVLAIVLAAFFGVPANLGGAVVKVAIHVAGGIDGYRLARAWPESKRPPWYARWAGIVPIMVACILGMVSLRAFVVEPFRIPSAAMIPTLVVGDYVLVSKSAYGLRVPVSGRRVVSVGKPRRGDVAVFRYPEKPEVIYLKRIVGIPGDRIAYVAKHLTINDQAVPLTPDSGYEAAKGWNELATKQYREELDGRTYRVLVDPAIPSVQITRVRAFPHREACEYSEQGFVCTVPPEHYFVMGDNRDASSDSRYWGFVPDANLIGRAFLVWCSERRPERIGLKIE